MTRQLLLAREVELRKEYRQTVSEQETHDSQSDATITVAAN